MDEEIERLVIAVRADTGGFARDVAAMRGSLEGGLGEGAGRAGRLVEASLLRAVRTGKLGFDDLKASALAVLNDIAAASLKGRSARWCRAAIWDRRSPGCWGSAAHRAGRRAGR